MRPDATDQPIPYWPTDKPAHHEASIPYRLTERAEQLVDYWATWGIDYAHAVHVDPDDDTIVRAAAARIEDMGPAAWAARCGQGGC